VNSSLATVNNRVVVGQVGRVHGIKGWLRLNSFTKPAEKLFEYKSLKVEVEQGRRQLEIDEFKPQGNTLLVHFSGYDEPESARQLTGLELSIDSSDLPQLEAGSYYWHQLEGLQVRNQQGQIFGQVSRLLETGANDVLVVTPGEGSLDARERLIPYVVDQVVKSVDVDKGTITVDWEADFLE
jgi:16S rRNA processing protein RimM